MNAFGTIRTSRRLTPPATMSLLLLLAPALAAQEPPPRPLGTPAPPDAPETPCVCAWEGEMPRMMRSFARFDRARLGVELGIATEIGGRTGIRLRSVEEGSPAEAAGLRAGDIAMSLNGTELGEDPGRRLRELMSDVEAGDTVTVGYVRDGREATARVVTDSARSFSVVRPGNGEFRWSAPGVPGPGMNVGLRGLFGDGLDLVAMNEGLGEYFGTDEGVLVASMDDDSVLGLRPGDVILSIDGRAVRDPRHARSIIASYRPEEAISFEVMRDGRRTTVTGSRDSR